MGRKSKLSKEQIAESILLIDGKKISLRKRAINLGISHPQLRDSIIKYKKQEKERLGTTQILKDNLEVTKRNKNIEQISKEMDQKLYKDHTENKRENDNKEYDKLVGSLRKQFNIDEKPIKPHKEQTKVKNVYLSLDLLRGLYVLITGKSEHHKKSRKELLILFSDLFKDQVNILR